MADRRLVALLPARGQEIFQAVEAVEHRRFPFFGEGDPRGLHEEKAHGGMGLREGAQYGTLGRHDAVRGVGHVRLPGAEPNVAHGYVVKAEFALRGGHFKREAGGGGHGVERDEPAPVGCSLRRVCTIGYAHSDGLTGVGRALDLDRPAALEHHVIGVHGRHAQPAVPPSQGLANGRGQQARALGVRMEAVKK